MLIYLRVFSQNSSRKGLPWKSMKLGGIFHIPKRKPRHLALNAGAQEKKLIFRRGTISSSVSDFVAIENAVYKTWDW